MAEPFNYRYESLLKYISKMHQSKRKISKRMSVEEISLCYKSSPNISYMSKDSIKRSICRKRTKSPSAFSHERARENSDKRKGFKLNLKSVPIPRKRQREKNKYEVMLEQLNKLKDDNKITHLLAGFPLSKVILKSSFICIFKQIF